MFKIILIGLIIWLFPYIMTTLQIVFFEDFINLIMGVAK